MRVLRFSKGDAPIQIYIITCTYNVSQILIDSAFQKESEAKAYAKEMNKDKAKAIVRCKELIALRDSEEMVKFLDEDSKIEFEIMETELK